MALFSTSKVAIVPPILYSDVKDARRLEHAGNFPQERLLYALGLARSIAGGPLKDAVQYDNVERAGRVGQILGVAPLD